MLAPYLCLLLGLSPYAGSAESVLPINLYQVGNIAAVLRTGPMCSLPRMTLPSSKVQQALSVTLLRMPHSPDLSREDAERVQQFALRMIAELNLTKAENLAPEEPVAI